MPWSHPDETKAQARVLCETTIMTYEEIGAAVGVPAPTIGHWKRTEGWTRPPEALQRRPIPRKKRNAAIRLYQAGGSPDDLAEILECDRKTAQRLCHEADDGLGPPAAFAPEEAAALQAALTGGGLDRRTLLRLAEEALARAVLQALTRRDPHARVQDLARTIQTIRTLPDDIGTAAGASSHDHQSGPATFDEENALLDELTRRLGAFGLGRRGGRSWRAFRSRCGATCMTAGSVRAVSIRFRPTKPAPGTPGSSGRGAGKTRAGAEWVNGMAGGLLGIAERRAMRIALVGETLADVRDVMVHGPSGLVAIAPWAERPRWQPSLRRLEWPSGAVAHAFSAEDPDSLRGPQFEAAWADELGKWRYAEATWDMLQFGLRLGSRPRQVVTTTPRPIPLIRALMEDPSVRLTRAGTAADAANLAPSFLEQVSARYGGTALGRQELDGELIEDRSDALWKRDAIEAARVAAAPALARIVVAVDPPASAGRRASACGIIAAGIDAGGMGYVLADETVSGAEPEAWAARAVALYRALQADALVAEVNQGGDMVAAVVRLVDPGVPVTAVVATRGKHAHTGRGACATPAPTPRSRTRCATSRRPACPAGARPTASTRSSGRSPTSCSRRGRSRACGRFKS